MTIDFNTLCQKVVELVTNNEILEQMIRETHADGLERGAEVQMDEAGKLTLGNFCTGNSCQVQIPYSATRIASFHTHPGVGESSIPCGLPGCTEKHPVTPDYAFSMGDLFSFLHHEEEASCVGQMVKGEKGLEPQVTCGCWDPMVYKAVLLEAMTRKFPI